MSIYFEVCQTKLQIVQNKLKKGVLVVVVVESILLLVEYTTTTSSSSSIVGYLYVV